MIQGRITDYAQDVTFHIFQLDDDGAVEAEVPNIHGQVEMRVRTERKRDIITVTIDNAVKQWNVMLSNTTSVEVIKGVKVSQDYVGTYNKG